MITDYSHSYFLLTKIFLQKFRIFLFFLLYKIISQLLLLKLGQKIKLAKKKKVKGKDFYLGSDIIHYVCNYT